MQGANGANLFRCPARRLGDRRQHVEDPFLPGSIRRDGIQSLVVARPLEQDVARQVQHRNIEQTLLDQHQQIEDAAGPPVAIEERVDGLELIVRHRHADQRIDVSALVDETFPVGQLLAQHGLALGRRVDHLIGRRVEQRRTRHAPDLHLHVLDPGAHLHRGVGGQGAVAQRRETLVQRAAIAQGLLGRGILGAVFHLCVAEERIRGGHDVLDLAAGLRLQQRDGVDQDGLVGDQRADALELGQGRPGFDAGLQQRLGLDVDGRREQGQVVVGLGRIECHKSMIPQSIDKSAGRVEGIDINVLRVDQQQKHRHI